MKLLFDLFPVILFFATFKLASSFPSQSLALATSVLGGLVGDGRVPPDQAPILLATATAIVATIAQVGWLLGRGRRVEPMLWISLAVIVIFGGATIWFHDETFIKWKPTVLYWLFAIVLAASASLFHKNLIRTMMEKQFSAPDFVWRNLNLSWMGFFLLMSVLNLYIAFNYSTDTWVNFKMFGTLGLMVVFVLLQGVYLSRHIQETP